MNVKFSRLSVTALGALANSTLTISHKTAYGVVAGNVLLQQVETNYAGYFAVFGKQGYSGMGDTVAEADLNRDEHFRGMRTILRGYIKISGFPFRQEALDLLAIIDQLVEDIDKLDYSAETEKLDKLFVEFDKEVNKAKLAKLNLTALYDGLKSGQAAFKGLFFEQTGANAELRQQSSASSLRNLLAESLRNYFALVTAMKMVDGWSGLYAELAEVVKAANSSVSEPQKTKPVVAAN